MPNEPKHIHAPDLATMHVETDGGVYYLDVNCACGRSGTLGEIYWDNDDQALGILTNSATVHRIPRGDIFRNEETGS